VPTRLIGWPAAILAMLITLTLVAGELTNAGQRRWWAARPLTTDTVSGLLVLLFTILVVNQLLNRRQARQRGHAVAAQAAIMVAQATRSAKAVSSLTGGSGDRGAASDGFRTYMMMLLIGAPVLIEDPVAAFPRAGSIPRRSNGCRARGDRQVNGRRCGAGQQDGRRRGAGRQAGDAMQQLQDAAAPLLQLLHPAIRDSIQGIGRTAEE
jgi:hypothetical protein